MTLFLSEPEAGEFQRTEPLLCKNEDGQHASEQTAICLPRASPKHGLTAIFQVNVIQNNAVIRSQNHMMKSSTCQVRILNWNAEFRQHLKF